MERLRRRRSRHALIAPFSGLEPVEIGGPSPIFGRRGALPVYSQLAGLVAVDYAPRTIWTVEHDDHDPAATHVIAEATAIPLDDGSCDGLLASHVLEHVANGLAALVEWRRVVRPGAPLLIVVPHRDLTFDHRRPITPLHHFLSDAAAGVAEDDLTHVEEVIALHDGRHDHFHGSRAAFERRCWENERHRALHHHVFVPATAVAVIDAAGLVVEHVMTLKPYHIAVLARSPTERR
jgi:SAM-dependent methyltransferase